MAFSFDHDLHIHSNRSSCSRDPEQTPERILRYAVDNGLRTVCLTNHFWDETVPGPIAWYEKQNYAWITRDLPLPRAEGVRFLFGCETELRKDLTLGLSRERAELFDFIVIPTTHFHFKNFTVEEGLESPAERADLWLKRLDAVLDMDLPFHKVGFAHLICQLIAKKDRRQMLEIVSLLPETELKRVFTRVAEKGAGVELNGENFGELEPEEEEILLRPFRIAKDCGCRFYFGSDAHSVDELAEAPAQAEKAIRLLELELRHQFVI